MIFDIIVVAVLLISAAIAFLRGFIREVLTILGVGGGLAASYFGGPVLAPHIRGMLGVEEGVVPERLFGILPYDILADILAYGLIFIVVVIVLSIISHLLAETVKTMGMGAIDRSLGVIFGLARGLLLVGLAYLPVHLYVETDTQNSLSAGSKTHFYVEKTADIMAIFLPEGAAERLEDEAANTRERLESIDLLRKDEEKPGQNTGSTPSEGAGHGYNEESRDAMDRLFEDNQEQRGLNE
ncbi:MAG: CvpA family protein [Alphaproteobacteria bacterium]